MAPLVLLGMPIIVVAALGVEKAETRKDLPPSEMHDTISGAAKTPSRQPFTISGSWMEGQREDASCGLKPIDLTECRMRTSNHSSYAAIRHRNAEKPARRYARASAAGTKPESEPH